MRPSIQTFMSPSSSSRASRSRAGPGCAAPPRACAVRRAPRRGYGDAAWPQRPRARLRSGAHHLRARRAARAPPPPRGRRSTRRGSRRSRCLRARSTSARSASRSRSVRSVNPSSTAPSSGKRSGAKAKASFPAAVAWSGTGSPSCGAARRKPRPSALSSTTSSPARAGHQEDGLAERPGLLLEHGPRRAPRSDRAPARRARAPRAARPADSGPGPPARPGRGGRAPGGGGAPWTSAAPSARAISETPRASRSPCRWKSRSIARSTDWRSSSISASELVPYRGTKSLINGTRLAGSPGGCHPRSFDRPARPASIRLAAARSLLPAASRESPR